jgi:hypothetical protein
MTMPTDPGVNGRGLADNAPEAVFCLATNGAVPPGLTAGQAAGSRSDAFPFVPAAS